MDFCRCDRKASGEFKIPSDHVISGPREFGDITSSCVSYGRSIQSVQVLSSSLFVCVRAWKRARFHRSSLFLSFSLPPLTSTARYCFWFSTRVATCVHVHVFFLHRHSSRPLTIPSEDFFFHGFLYCVYTGRLCLSRSPASLRPIFPRIIFEFETRLYLSALPPSMTMSVVWYCSFKLQILANNFVRVNWLISIRGKFVYIFSG